MIAAALGFWITLSPLVGWLAGRFIRAGMVDRLNKETPP
jgi:putative Mn2+ efflux pump MntP